MYNMSLFLALCLVQGWRTGAPMPHPGYGFACAELEGKVYCIGGLTEGAVDSVIARRANEAYDARADSWITGLAPLPQPCWFAGCAVLEGRIYVIGGFDGKRELRRVMRYDPRANAWDTVASLPIPLQALAAVAYNGGIHALGGYTTSSGRPYFSRRAYRFIPDSGPGRWVETDSMRTPRASFAASELAGRLFVTGGKYFSNVRAVEYYVRDRWEEWPQQLPEPRNGHTSVAAGDYLAVLGGITMQGMTGSVLLLNANAGSWIRAAPLPIPCTYAGAAVVDARVVSIGGRSNRGVVAAVQLADSLLIPGGIAEEEGRTLPRTSLPSVISSSALLELSGPASILDRTGRVVLKTERPARLALAPGVYFVCTPVPGVASVPARKLVVVK